MKDIIYDYILEHPNCNFVDIAKQCGKARCGEVWEALTELAGENKIDIIDGERFRYKPDRYRLIETVQFMMVFAFPKMDDPNRDLREIFREIYSWAQEFEDAWNNLPLSEQERRGFGIEVCRFCKEKLWS